MSNHRPPLWWLGPAGYAMAGGLLMALGAGILSLGVVRVEGLLASIGFSVAGLVMALVGLAAVALGLKGVLDKGAGQDEGRRLEERAEQQGLPTEPEAYQDGGLAVAVTTGNLAEAELLAAMLKGEGIPAWVGGATMASLQHLAYRPADGIRVLVPRGRLEDAWAILDEKRAGGGETQEEGSTPDLSEAESNGLP